MNKPKKPKPPLKRDFQSCNEMVFILDENTTFTNPIDLDGTLSLQSIIDLVPKDIPFKNIHISPEDDYGIQVYYYINRPARIKDFEAAIEQFKLDEEQYQKDKIIYAEFIKNEKVKELEKELKRLKK